MNEIHQELDPWTDVLRLAQKETLKSFIQIWYHIFLWNLSSSIFIHSIAAIIAFTTLRKHKFGRFFSIFILIMGFLTPFCGMISTGMISFVYTSAGLQMSPIFALLWGLGQTACVALLGVTRILATL